MSNGHHKMGNSAVVLSKRRYAQTSQSSVSENHSTAKPVVAAEENVQAEQHYREGGTPACQNHVSRNEHHCVHQDKGTRSPLIRLNKMNRLLRRM